MRAQYPGPESRDSAASHWDKTSIILRFDELHYLKEKTMIDINKLTLGEIKEIQSLLISKKEQSCPWELNKNYFIRTVTMHLIGELSFISDKELVLKNASWIADSGRFHTALKDGELNEVEPFIEDVIVNRGSIIDATKWLHDVPRSQK